MGVKVQVIWETDRWAPSIVEKLTTEGSSEGHTFSCKCWTTPWSVYIPPRHQVIHVLVLLIDYEVHLTDHSHPFSPTMSGGALLRTYNLILSESPLYSSLQRNRMEYLLRNARLWV